jgi:hypothetical protein
MLSRFLSISARTGSLPRAACVAPPAFASRVARPWAAAAAGPFDDARGGSRGFAKVARTRAQCHHPHPALRSMENRYPLPAAAVGNDRAARTRPRRCAPGWRLMRCRRGSIRARRC